MKLLSRVLLVLVSVVVVVGIVAYLRLDAILKDVVQKESTASLRLATTLDSAHLSLFGGKLGLNGLRIASPKGFSAPHMMEVGKIDLAVRYSELRQHPIHVGSLTIAEPTLVIEQSGGALNFKKAADGMAPSKSSGEPIKLVIDELKVQDAKVIVRPGLPGLQQEITVSVPTLSLKDVGRGKGAQNGAAIKDVAMVVISALAAHAAESGSLPAELKSLLHLNVANVAGQLGAEARKQLATAVPGNLGKQLSNIADNPGAVIKNPGSALPGELGGILGGNKKDAGRPAASGRASTPPKR
jgi:hypothetical protein